MSVRRILVSGFVVALFLSGCSSEGSGNSGASHGVHGMSASPVASGLRSGIGLRYYSNGFDDVVGVFDPKTGTRLQEVKLPANLRLDPQRDSFDPSMHQLVYVTGCDLYLASLQQDTFQNIGHWQPPQSYGQRECFQSTVFKPNGRVWVDGDSSSGRPRHVWSLDPANPNSQLQDEGSAGSDQDRHLRIDGSNSQALLRPSDGASTASLQIDYDGSDYVPSYSCQAVDETTFVCVYQMTGPSDFGGIAAAKVDLAAGRVSLKQIAPVDKSNGGWPLLPPDILVASDHQRIAIRDQGVWFVAPLDGSQQPTQLPLEQNGNFKALFWS